MKTKGKSKLALLVMATLLFGMVIVGCTNNSTGTTTTQTADNGEIEISADDLRKAYDDNEVNADNMYKGKKLLITGKIDDIGNSATDNTFIVMGRETLGLTGVQCYFSEQSEIDKVSQLQKDQEVTVEGVCQGKNVNVAIQDCKLQ